MLILVTDTIVFRGENKIISRKNYQMNLFCLKLYPKGYNIGLSKEDYTRLGVIYDLINLIVPKGYNYGIIRFYKKTKETASSDSA